jgi:DNA-binding transcriptional LysR family regulator
MNLDYYKNFRIIVETGSLTAAAEKLHIARSALSVQLRALEEKFGTKLIITKPGSRHIEITKDGEILYNKAEYLCNFDDFVLREIKARNNGTEGTLTVALTPSMSTSSVADFLSGFSKRYPNVRFKLYEGTVPELECSILDGLAEVGLSGAPLEHVELFNVVRYYTDSLAAVYLKENQWLPPIKGDSLSIKMLENIPLHVSTACLPVLRDACTDAQFSPNIRSVNTAKATTIMWARQERGIAIVHVGETDHFEENLCAKKIEPYIQIKKTLVTAKNHTLSPVLLLFLQYCEEIGLWYDGQNNRSLVNVAK